jgi:hypothetical protein
MSWIGMTALLVVALALFAWIAQGRWRLMLIGPRTGRWDHIGTRVAGTLRFAFGQRRMPRYRLAGTAHILIFVGFLVLLVRSLILIGRGYSLGFDLWILGEGTVLGSIYSVLKDVFVLLVLVGVAVFTYYRLIGRPKRMTLGFEGLLILLIIAVMMFAELLYDGANLTIGASERGTPVS